MIMKGPSIIILTASGGGVFELGRERQGLQELRIHGVLRSFLHVAVYPLHELGFWFRA